MSHQSRKEHLSHRQIRTVQAAEKEQIEQRVFAPNETTRDGNQYFLPFLPEYRFGRGKITYEKAKEQKLKEVPTVRVLDLGCGAGFWMEEQTQNPRLEVFGISARDYRHRADRPEVVFLRHDDSTGEPIFTNPDGHHYYIGLDLDRDAAIGDAHYLIGDIHDVLRTIPENFFHLIVSNQACRYLFDPLRVLKQVHRVLAPNGYAFLESFCPIIYDRQDRLVISHLQKILTKGGHLARFGEYCPDDLHERVGLAIKKNRRRLHLPLRYRCLEPNPTAGTSTVTYYLD